MNLVIFHHLSLFTIIDTYEDTTEISPTILAQGLTYLCLTALYILLIQE
jgi:hypothetical protein